MHGKACECRGQWGLGDPDRARRGKGKDGQAEGERELVGEMYQPRRREVAGG